MAKKGDETLGGKQWQLQTLQMYSASRTVRRCLMRRDLSLGGWRGGTAERGVYHLYFTSRTANVNHIQFSLKPAGNLLDSLCRVNPLKPAMPVPFEALLPYAIMLGVCPHSQTASSRILINLQMMTVSGVGLTFIKSSQNGGKWPRHNMDRWDKVRISSATESSHTNKLLQQSEHIH